MRGRISKHFLAGNEPPGTTLSLVRRVMRLILAGFYLVAGLLHLVFPSSFLPIMPDWVPHARAVIEGTGWCEIAGAIELIHPSTRKIAGAMLALYAICVYPANLKHAFQHVDVQGLPSSWLYHGPRLALQPILVWWSFLSSGWVSWPFSSLRSR